jgi:hypothetical protein
MEKSSSPSASVGDDKSFLFQNPELQVPPWEPQNMCLPVSSDRPGGDTAEVNLMEWFVPVDNPRMISHQHVSDVRTTEFTNVRTTVFVLAQTCTNCGSSVMLLTASHNIV